MKHALALIALAAMAACTTTPVAKSPMGSSETAVMPPEQADACKAASYQTLIGKPATDPAVPPADKLVRHIRPDSIVTMDYVFKRLNIEIDMKGVITGVRCG
ncbi:MAG: hypothetical protein EON93_15360 [Burkholderiales bacterium]|nr:MAG: hypothetical protein EON93_15360 [Burkholderiales bacterium]